jgi:hypothetical protein
MYICTHTEVYFYLYVLNLGDLDAIDEDGDGGEMEQEPAVPLIDEDGFETVVRGSKKTGKKK